MTEELYVNLEDARWSDLEALASRAFAACFAHFGMDPAGYEISLLGCDDARIAGLNAEFRGKPAPTNVLSWPADDRAPPTPGADPAPVPPDPTGMPAELGDIAIAYETCVREAAEAGKNPPDHVTHLLVHGFLHLLGYDHIDDKDAARMQEIEAKILGNLGIDDPYEPIDA